MPLLSGTEVGNHDLNLQSRSDLDCKSAPPVFEMKARAEIGIRGKHCQSMYLAALMSSGERANF